MYLRLFKYRTQEIFKILQTTRRSKQNQNYCHALRKQASKNALNYISLKVTLKIII